MNLYDATIPVFSKFLQNVDRWFQKTAVYAEQRKFDPEILVAFRLAPDQYPLSGQVQALCDTTKYGAAKLTGKEAPSIPDTEKTIAELRNRIATARSYLETFTPADFLGAEDRPCTYSWLQGKHMRGGDYLDHFVLPNLHFHLTTTYSILRHNGVPLGKMDYVGELPLR